MREHLFANRVVALLTAVFFLLSNSSFQPAFALNAPAETNSLSSRAFPPDLAGLQVPPGMGTIEDFSKGSDGRMVVLIQDAHEIPDAQKNIQRLIDYFQKHYGVNLVALEGANAPLDPRIFKSFPDKEVLKKVFKNYQEQGELTAGEGAALFGREGGSYEGVEDWNLYQEGIGLYLQAMQKEEAVFEKLKEWKSRLAQEKEKIYPRELLEIDQTLEGFYQNQGALLQTLQKLAAVQAPPAGSALALLLQEGAAQAGGDSLELEVKKIAEQVARVISNPEGVRNPGFEKRDFSAATRLRNDISREFNAKYQEFKTSRMTAKAFGLYLKKLVAARHLRVKVSKVLAGSVQDQRRMEEIQGTKFFEDFEHYAEEVKNSLLENEDQRKLGRESRQLQITQRFAKLEISREDWEEIRSFRTSEGGEKSQSLEISQSPLTGLLRNDMERHFAFYQNSEKRDAAFTKNLDRLMRKKRAVSAILVAGGFHTEGLTRRLKDQGISFLRVMPAIEALPEETHYREHMQGEVSWKKYLQPEAGKINLYKAFVRGARDKLLKIKPVPDPEHPLPGREMKAWRDQIILDLAKENRLDRAGEYTAFIDELADGGKKEKLRAEWMANVEKFVEGLRGLQNQNALNRENVLNLLKLSSISTTIVNPNKMASGGDPSLAIADLTQGRASSLAAAGLQDAEAEFRLASEVREAPPAARSENRNGFDRLARDGKLNLKAGKEFDDLEQMIFGVQNRWGYILTQDSRKNKPEDLQAVRQEISKLISDLFSDAKEIDQELRRQSEPDPRMGAVGEGFRIAKLLGALNSLRDAFVRNSQTSLPLSKISYYEGAVDFTPFGLPVTLENSEARLLIAWLTENPQSIYVESQINDYLTKEQFASKFETLKNIKDWQNFYDELRQIIWSTFGDAVMGGIDFKGGLRELYSQQRLREEREKAAKEITQILTKTLNAAAPVFAPEAREYFRWDKEGAERLVVGLHVDYSKHGERILRIGNLEFELMPGESNPAAGQFRIHRIGAEDSSWGPWNNNPVYYRALYFLARRFAQNIEILLEPGHVYYRRIISGPQKDSYFGIAADTGALLELPPGDFLEVEQMKQDLGDATYLEFRDGIFDVANLIRGIILTSKLDLNALPPSNPNEALVKGPLAIFQNILPRSETRTSALDDAYQIEGQERSAEEEAAVSTLPELTEIAFRETEEFKAWARALFKQLNLAEKRRLHPVLQQVYRSLFYTVENEEERLASSRLGDSEGIRENFAIVMNDLVRRLLAPEDTTLGERPGEGERLDNFLEILGHLKSGPGSLNVLLGNQLRAILAIKPQNRAGFDKAIAQGIIYYGANALKNKAADSSDGKFSKRFVQLSRQINVPDITPEQVRDFLAMYDSLKKVKASSAAEKTQKRLEIFDRYLRSELEEEAPPQLVPGKILLTREEALEAVKEKYTADDEYLELGEGLELLSLLQASQAVNAEIIQVEKVITVEGDQSITTYEVSLAPGKTLDDLTRLFQEPVSEAALLTDDQKIEAIQKELIDELKGDNPAALKSNIEIVKKIIEKIKNAEDAGASLIEEEGEPELKQSLADKLADRELSSDWADPFSLTVLQNVLAALETLNVEVPALAPPSAPQAKKVTTETAERIWELLRNTGLEKAKKQTVRQFLAAVKIRTREEAIPYLIEALSWTSALDLTGVEYARMLLGAFGMKAVPALIVTLQAKDDAQKRGLAAVILEKIIRIEREKNPKADYPDVVSALIKAADKEENPKVFANLVKALFTAAPENEEAVKSLSERLKDKDEEIRKIASEALETHGKKGLTELEVPALPSPVAPAPPAEKTDQDLQSNAVEKQFIADLIGEGVDVLPVNRKSLAEIIRMIETGVGNSFFLPEPDDPEWVLSGKFEALLARRGLSREWKDPVYLAILQKVSLALQEYDQRRTTEKYDDLVKEAQETSDKANAEAPVSTAAPAPQAALNDEGVDDEAPDALFDFSRPEPTLEEEKRYQEIVDSIDEELPDVRTSSGDSEVAYQKLVQAVSKKLNDTRKKLVKTYGEKAPDQALQPAGWLSNPFSNWKKDAETYQAAYEDWMRIYQAQRDLRSLTKSVENSEISGPPKELPLALKDIAASVISHYEKGYYPAKESFAGTNPQNLKNGQLLIAKFPSPKSARKGEDKYLFFYVTTEGVAPAGILFEVSTGKAVESKTPIQAGVESLGYLFQFKSGPREWGSVIKGADIIDPSIRPTARSELRATAKGPVSAQDLSETIERFAGIVFKGRERPEGFSEKIEAFLTALEDANRNKLDAFLENMRKIFSLSSANKAQQFAANREIWKGILRGLLAYPPADANKNYKNIQQAILIRIELEKMASPGASRSGNMNKIASELLKYLNREVKITVRGKPQTVYLKNLDKIFKLLFGKEAAEPQDALRKYLEKLNKETREAEKRANAESAPSKAKAKAAPKPKAAPKAKPAAKTVKLPKKIRIPNQDRLLKMGLSSIWRKYSRLTRALDKAEDAAERPPEATKAARLQRAILDLAAESRAKAKAEKKPIPNPRPAVKEFTLLIARLKAYLAREMDPEGRKVARNLLGLVYERLRSIQKEAGLRNKTTPLAKEIRGLIRQSAELYEKTQKRTKQPEDQFRTDIQKSRKAFVKALNNYKQPLWKIWNLPMVFAARRAAKRLERPLPGPSAKTREKNAAMEKMLGEIWFLRQVHRYQDSGLMGTLEPFYVSLRRAIYANDNPGVVSSRSEQRGEESAVEDINIADRGKSAHDEANEKFLELLIDKFRRQRAGAAAGEDPEEEVEQFRKDRAAGKQSFLPIAADEVILTDELPGQPERIFFLEGLEGTAPDEQIGHAGLGRNQVFAPPGQWDIVAHELTELRLWKAKERELIENGEIDPAENSGKPRNIREWIKDKLKKGSPESERRKARDLDRQFHILGKIAEQRARNLELQFEEDPAEKISELVQALIEEQNRAAKTVDGLIAEAKSLSEDGKLVEAYEKLRQAKTADDLSPQELFLQGMIDEDELAEARNRPSAARRIFTALFPLIIAGLPLESLDARDRKRVEEYTGASEGFAEAQAAFDAAADDELDQAEEELERIAGLTETVLQKVDADLEKLRSPPGTEKFDLKTASLNFDAASAVKNLSRNLLQKFLDFLLGVAEKLGMWKPKPKPLSADLEAALRSLGQMLDQAEGERDINIRALQEDPLEGDPFENFRREDVSFSNLRLVSSIDLNWKNVYGKLESLDAKIRAFEEAFESSRANGFPAGEKNALRIQLTQILDDLDLAYRYVKSEFIKGREDQKETVEKMLGNFHLSQRIQTKDAESEAKLLEVRRSFDKDAEALEMNPSQGALYQLYERNLLEMQDFIRDAKRAYRAVEALVELREDPEGDAEFLKDRYENLINDVNLFEERGGVKFEGAKFGHSLFHILGERARSLADPKITSTYSFSDALNWNIRDGLRAKFALTENPYGKRLVTLRMGLMAQIDGLAADWSRMEERWEKAFKIGRLTLAGPALLQSRPGDDFQGRAASIRKGLSALQFQFAKEKAFPGPGKLLAAVLEVLQNKQLLPLNERYQELSEEFGQVQRKQGVDYAAAYEEWLAAGSELKKISADIEAAIQSARSETRSSVTEAKALAKDAREKIMQLRELVASLSDREGFLKKPFWGEGEASFDVRLWAALGGETDRFRTIADEIEKLRRDSALLLGEAIQDENLNDLEKGKVLESDDDIERTLNEVEQLRGQILGLPEKVAAAVTAQAARAKERGEVLRSQLEAHLKKLFQDQEPEWPRMARSPVFFRVEKLPPAEVQAMYRELKKLLPYLEGGDYAKGKAVLKEFDSTYRYTIFPDMYLDVYVYSPYLNRNYSKYFKVDFRNAYFDSFYSSEETYMDLLRLAENVEKIGIQLTIIPPENPDDSFGDVRLEIIDEEKLGDFLASRESEGDSSYQDRETYLEALEDLYRLAYGFYLIARRREEEKTKKDQTALLFKTLRSVEEIVFEERFGKKLIDLDSLSALAGRQAPLLGTRDEYSVVELAKLFNKMSLEEEKAIVDAGIKELEDGIAENIEDPEKKKKDERLLLNLQGKLEDIDAALTAYEENPLNRENVRFPVLPSLPKERSYNPGENLATPRLEGSEGVLLNIGDQVSLRIQFDSETRQFSLIPDSEEPLELTSKTSVVVGRLQDGKIPEGVDYAVAENLTDVQMKQAEILLDPKEGTVRVINRDSNEILVAGYPFVPRSEIRAIAAAKSIDEGILSLAVIRRINPNVEGNRVAIERLGRENSSNLDPQSREAFQKLAGYLKGNQVEQAWVIQDDGLNILGAYLLLKDGTVVMAVLGESDAQNPVGEKLVEAVTRDRARVKSGYTVWAGFDGFDLAVPKKEIEGFTAEEVTWFKMALKYILNENIDSRRRMEEVGIDQNFKEKIPEFYFTKNAENGNPIIRLTLYTADGQPWDFDIEVYPPAQEKSQQKRAKIISAKISTESEPPPAAAVTSKDVWEVEGYSFKPVQKAIILQEFEKRGFSKTQPVSTHLIEGENGNKILTLEGQTDTGEIRKIELIIGPDGDVVDVRAYGDPEKNGGVDFDRVANALKAAGGVRKVFEGYAEIPRNGAVAVNDVTPSDQDIQRKGIQVVSLTATDSNGETVTLKLQIQEGEITVIEGKLPGYRYKNGVAGKEFDYLKRPHRAAVLVPAIDSAYDIAPATPRPDQDKTLNDGDVPLQPVATNVKAKPAAVPVRTPLETQAEAIAAVNQMNTATGIIYVEEDKVREPLDREQVIAGIQKGVLRVDRVKATRNDKEIEYFEVVLVPGKKLQDLVESPTDYRQAIAELLGTIAGVIGQAIVDDAVEQPQNRKLTKVERDLSFATQAKFFRWQEQPAEIKPDELLADLDFLQQKFGVKPGTTITIAVTLEKIDIYKSIELMKFSIRELQKKDGPAPSASRVNAIPEVSPKIEPDVNRAVSGFARLGFLTREDAAAKKKGTPIDEKVKRSNPESPFINYGEEVLLGALLDKKLAYKDGEFSERSPEDQKRINDSRAELNRRAQNRGLVKNVGDQRRPELDNGRSVTVYPEKGDNDEIIPLSIAGRMIELGLLYFDGEKFRIPGPLLRNLVSHELSEKMRVRIQDAKLFFDGGSKLLGEKNFVKSAEFLEKSLNLNPDNAEGWLNLANAYSALGFADRAQTALEKAISIWQQQLKNDPKNAEILFKLGVSLAHLGKDTEAKEVFEKILGIRPGNKQVLAALDRLKAPSQAPAAVPKPAPAPAAGSKDVFKDAYQKVRESLQKIGREVSDRFWAAGNLWEDEDDRLKGKISAQLKASGFSEQYSDILKAWYDHLKGKDITGDKGKKILEDYKAKMGDPAARQVVEIIAFAGFKEVEGFLFNLEGLDKKANQLGKQNEAFQNLLKELEALGTAIGAKSDSELAEFKGPLADLFGYISSSALEPFSPSLHILNGQLVSAAKRDAVQAKVESAAIRVINQAIIPALQKMTQAIRSEKRAQLEKLTESAKTEFITAFDETLNQVFSLNAPRKLTPVKLDEGLPLDWAWIIDGVFRGIDRRNTDGSLLQRLNELIGALNLPREYLNDPHLFAALRWLDEQPRDAEIFTRAQRYAAALKLSMHAGNTGGMSAGTEISLPKIILETDPLVEAFKSAADKNGWTVSVTSSDDGLKIKIDSTSRSERRTGEEERQDFDDWMLTLQLSKEGMKTREDFMIHGDLGSLELLAGLLERYKKTEKGKTLSPDGVLNIYAEYLNILTDVPPAGDKAHLDVVLKMLNRATPGPDTRSREIAAAAGLSLIAALPLFLLMPVLGAVLYALYPLAAVALSLGLYRGYQSYKAGQDSRESEARKSELASLLQDAPYSVKKAFGERVEERTDQEIASAIAADLEENSRLNTSFKNDKNLKILPYLKDMGRSSQDSMKANFNRIVNTELKKIFALQGIFFSRAGDNARLQEIAQDILKVMNLENKIAAVNRQAAKDTLVELAADFFKKRREFSAARGLLQGIVPLEKFRAYLTATQTALSDINEAKSTVAGLVEDLFQKVDEKIKSLQASEEAEKQAVWLQKYAPQLAVLQSLAIELQDAEAVEDALKDFSLSGDASRVQLVPRGNLKKALERLQAEPLFKKLEINGELLQFFLGQLRSLNLKISKGDLGQGDDSTRSEFRSVAASQKAEALMDQALKFRDLHQLDYDDPDVNRELIRLFSEVVEIDPKNADAWFFLGINYSNASSNQMAVQSLERASALFYEKIKTDPSDENSYRRLEVALQRIEAINKKSIRPEMNLEEAKKEIQRIAIFLKEKLHLSDLANLLGPKVINRITYYVLGSAKFHQTPLQTEAVLALLVQIIRKDQKILSAKTLQPTPLQLNAVKKGSRLVRQFISKQGREYKKPKIRFIDRGNLEDNDALAYGDIGKVILTVKSLVPAEKNEIAEGQRFSHRTIHEILHTNSQGFVSKTLDEGMTEYLTRRIMMAQEGIANPKDMNFIDWRTYGLSSLGNTTPYDIPSGMMLMLAKILGDDFLIKVYLTGDDTMPPGPDSERKLRVWKQVVALAERIDMTSGTDLFKPGILGEASQMIEFAEGIKSIAVQEGFDWERLFSERLNDIRFSDGRILKDSEPVKSSANLGPTNLLKEKNRSEIRAYKDEIDKLRAQINAKPKIAKDFIANDKLEYNIWELEILEGIRASAAQGTPMSLEQILTAVRFLKAPSEENLKPASSLVINNIRPASGSEEKFVEEWVEGIVRSGASAAQLQKVVNQAFAFMNRLTPYYIKDVPPGGVVVGDPEIQGRIETAVRNAFTKRRALAPALRLIMPAPKSELREEQAAARDQESSSIQLIFSNYDIRFTSEALQRYGKLLRQNRQSILRQFRKVLANGDISLRPKGWRNVLDFKFGTGKPSYRLYFKLLDKQFVIVAAFHHADIDKSSGPGSQELSRIAQWDTTVLSARLAPKEISDQFLRNEMGLVVQNSKPQGAEQNQMMQARAEWRVLETMNEFIEKGLFGSPDIENRTDEFNQLYWNALDRLEIEDRAGQKFSISKEPSGLVILNQDGIEAGILGFSFEVVGGILAAEIGYDLQLEYQGNGLTGSILEKLSQMLPDEIPLVGIGIQNVPTLVRLAQELPREQLSSKSTEVLDLWESKDGVFFKQGEYVDDPENSFAPKDFRILEAQNVLMADLARFYRSNAQLIPSPEILGETKLGRIRRNFGNQIWITPSTRRKQGVDLFTAKIPVEEVYSRQGVIRSELQQESLSREQVLRQKVVNAESEKKISQKQADFLFGEINAGRMENIEGQLPREVTGPETPRASKSEFRINLEGESFRVTNVEIDRKIDNDRDVLIKLRDGKGGSWEVFLSLTKDEPQEAALSLVRKLGEEDGDEETFVIYLSRPEQVQEIRPVLEALVKNQVFVNELRKYSGLWKDYINALPPELQQKIRTAKVEKTDPSQRLQILNQILNEVWPQLTLGERASWDRSLDLDRVDDLIEKAAPADFELKPTDRKAIEKKLTERSLKEAEKALNGSQIQDLKLLQIKSGSTIEFGDRDFHRAIYLSAVLENGQKVHFAILSTGHLVVLLNGDRDFIAVPGSRLLRWLVQLLVREASINTEILKEMDVNGKDWQEAAKLNFFPPSWKKAMNPPSNKSEVREEAPRSEDRGQEKIKPNESIMGNGGRALALVLAPEPIRSSQEQDPRVIAASEEALESILKEKELDTNRVRLALQQAVDEWLKDIEHQSSVKNEPLVGMEVIRFFTNHLIQVALARNGNRKVDLSVLLSVITDKGKQEALADAFQQLNAHVDRVIIVAPESGDRKPAQDFSGLLRARELLFTVLKNITRLNSNISTSQSVMPVVGEGSMAGIRGSDLFGVGVEGISDPLLNVAESVLQVVTAVLVASSVTDPDELKNPEKMKLLQAELLKEMMDGLGVGYAPGVLSYKEGNFIVQRDLLSQFLLGLQTQAQASAKAKAAA